MGLMPGSVVQVIQTSSALDLGVGGEIEQDWALWVPFEYCICYSLTCEFG
jgi:hypothetical protein